jgi:hypothetical protein
VTLLADAVFWAGAGFEVLGLAVGAVGFRRTWREFSTGDRMFGKEIEWAKNKYKAVKDYVHRRLGRKQVAAPPQVTASINLTLSMDGASGVGYVGLPSPIDDPEAFASAVGERLRSLNDNVRTLREQLDSEVGAREAADHKVSSELRTKVAEVEGLSRQIAIGGLREQVVGWSCIVVGIILQSLATPFM